MRREPFTRPIPSGLRDTLSMELDDVQDINLRYKVRRLVEVAYGEGYDDGHMNGAREQSDDDRVETSKLRDELAKAKAVANAATDTVDEVASALRDGRNITVHPDGGLEVSNTPPPATPA